MPDGRTGSERPTPFEAIRIGGLHTAVITRAALAKLMVADALAARACREPVLPKLVFSSNGQGISLAATSRRYTGAMACADLIHADGMSVVLASRLLTSSPLPERIATTDFFHDAARAAQESGIGFFLLGGSDEENAAACGAVRRLYPDLKIAGRHHGYFPAAENTRVCKAVVASGAEVLWVALGKPKQEFWSIENREHLRGLAWIKTCGGLYAFLAERRRRAPSWMQSAGLEWAFRGMQEPLRLGWRYLATNPHAMWRMLVDSNTPTARLVVDGAIAGQAQAPLAGRKDSREDSHGR